MSLLATGLLWLIVCLWPDHGLHFDYPLLPRDFQKEDGFAYYTTIPTKDRLLISSDDVDHPTRSRTIFLENGHPLGPAHSMHDNIRKTGAGAFSQWGELIYFSTSDNSDPRTNGRFYSIRAILRPSAKTDLLVVAFGMICALLHLRTIRRGFRRLLPAPSDAAPASKQRRRIILFLLAAITVPIFVALDGEFWMRLKHANMFSEIKYPGAWLPEVGFLFKANSVIQYTNHTDYWVRQTTNSFGFADREWSKTKAKGAFRVAFIGNSFVEAIHVPVSEKLQVQFEKAANRDFAPRRFETAAFANAGTGQANQLAFYDYAGCLFHPDVVVLVVNYTDLAYNSAVLECVRNGWNPDHLPRPFFSRKAPSAPFIRTQPDPDWLKLLLASPSLADAPKTKLAGLNEWLTARSSFYCWLSAVLPLKFPTLSSLQPQGRSVSEINSERIAAIRRIPGYEHSLDGWYYPRDWDADRMFGAQNLAPVFREAVEATGVALDAFLERGRRDGFRLVILTTALVSTDIADPEIEKETGNHGIDGGCFSRIKHLADERGIPVVAFGGYPEKRGIDPIATHWAHDLHWNALGHQLAAEELIEQFKAHPEWLEPVGGHNQ